MHWFDIKIDKYNNNKQQHLHVLNKRSKIQVTSKLMYKRKDKLLVGDWELDVTESFVATGC